LVWIWHGIPKIHGMLGTFRALQFIDPKLRSSSGLGSGSFASLAYTLWSFTPRELVLGATTWNETSE
jgi:hypothetical protein